MDPETLLSCSHLPSPYKLPLNFACTICKETHHPDYYLGSDVHIWIFAPATCHQSHCAAMQQTIAPLVTQIHSMN